MLCRQWTAPSWPVGRTPPIGSSGRTTLQFQDVTATTDGQALFDIVVDYTYALNTLDNYDYERLVIERTTTKEPFRATYESRHATLPCHQKSFVQRRKQAYCRNLVSLFLEHNGILYRPDGTKRLADNTLVALTLMIAESRTEEKDVMVKVVVNLINQRNERGFFTFHPKLENLSYKTWKCL